MDSDRRPFIATYIEASRPFGVLYIGVTSNLYTRGAQHRDGVIEGFSKRHGCKMLVWYQRFELITAAIRREKALKRWNRAWNATDRAEQPRVARLVSIPVRLGARSSGQARG